MLNEPFTGITKLIGVTPVKNHQRAGASMTLKNWYGLLGGRRNQFHQDIDGIIVELAMLIRPTFVVLDGTQSMMTNGPTGLARGRNGMGRQRRQWRHQHHYQERGSHSGRPDFGWRGIPGSRRGSAPVWRRNWP